MTLIDPDDGLISVREVHNIFIEAIRMLDKEILPDDRTVPRRDLVIEHFESIRHRCLQRAKPIAHYIPQKPTKKPTNEPTIDARAQHESRIARIRSHGP